ncbi:hypothetical protein DERF_007733 [Dermatophagoides farinae]|uniref:Uncharacterized protein n=1 Tax=Dermatophagoides farinae TaxID=6954 RepID=A0A922L3H6_DERFA|nr:hypothetical protein DERF_007733 [Dermatophagoides farinae]
MAKQVVLVFPHHSDNAVTVVVVVVDDDVVEKAILFLDFLLLLRFFDIFLPLFVDVGFDEFFVKNEYLPILFISRLSSSPSLENKDGSFTLII